MNCCTPCIGSALLSISIIMEMVTLCNLHGFLLKQMDTFSHTLWLLRSNEELSPARDDGNIRSPYEPITSLSSHRSREPLFIIAWIHFDWRKSGKRELISRSIKIQPTKKRSTEAGSLHIQLLPRMWGAWHWEDYELWAWLWGVCALTSLPFGFRASLLFRRAQKQGQVLKDTPASRGRR